MSSSPRIARSAFREGAQAMAPMLIGVAPFGLVAGATPVANGLGADVAIGFSVVVFAGASQLAAIGILSDGGSALVAVLAACTINLRMLLYSASLAPSFAHQRLRHRLAVAYLLTDQAYALSILASAADDGADDGPLTRRRRLSFFLGAGVSLWVVWQLSTMVGLLIGRALPPRAQLDFAVPLVFLVLLVPTLSTRPAVVAAAFGGGAAILAGQLGAGPLSVIVGSLVGIGAGALADTDAHTARPGRST